jgi:hypothetical protein
MAKMKLFQDIQSPWLLHAKGCLFLVLGLMAAAFLWLETPTLRTLGLLVITIWAFCRFYYFLFYVLEKYLGQERAAGLVDALKLLWKKRGENREK